MDVRSERSSTRATVTLSVAAGTRLGAEEIVDGRYRIETLLGAGAMGTVYRATHLSVGRSVALKVLAPQWAEHASMPDRFRDEARAASAIGHPNIVEVFDAGHLSDGRPYLVMELLAGRSLAQHIEDDGPMPVERACAILRGVARALAAAHHAGVIHRDLKPENVMLVPSEDGDRVKVLDFGVAADTGRVGARRTVAGTVMGTAEYMAPEQILGERARPAFDIHAFGVIAFEVLSARLPLGGSTTDEVMTKKLDSDAPSLATVRDDLPHDLVALVDACLASKPEERPASAREIDERLAVIERRIRGASAERSALVGVAPSTAPTGRSRAGLALAASIIALVGLAFAIAMLDEAPPAVAAAPDRSEPAPPTSPSRDPSAAPSSIAEVDAAPPGDARSDVPSIAPVASDAPVSTNAASAPASAAVPNEPRVACAGVRSKADRARQTQDWAGLLVQVAHRSCFSAAERQRLRTKAYMELEQFDRCGATGSGSADPDVRRWAQLCQRRDG